MKFLSVNELKNPLNYNEYKALITDLASKNKCTGEQIEEKIKATLINVQRIKRLDKQIEINSDLKTKIKEISEKQVWVILVESWCGDAAQCLPVIAKIVEINTNIDLKIILRDENLSIMDQFLTNGSRSIPKLILIENEEIIDTWGPRPKGIQKMVLDYKQANPNASHDEFVANLHLWYARDKTISLQNDFMELLTNKITR
ncbi:MAG: thioredoxin family protein [Bacteroidia bacterium]|nr:thioredoxin family protein [Bacteroidia bacterium]